MDQQVKDQLDAIELELAKLEEQLEQNGVSPPTSNSSSVSNSATEEPNASNSVAQANSNPLSSEEATSEMHAIDELLARLEQRKRAGGVEEETYQRLREKYLKRRSELV
jgi:predicted RecB family endonuclease